MQKIPDTRMNELIQRARDAATKGFGGGDGSSYVERFYPEVYETTLKQLIANEQPANQKEKTNG